MTDSVGRNVKCTNVMHSGLVRSHQHGDHDKRSNQKHNSEEITPVSVQKKINDPPKHTTPSIPLLLPKLHDILPRPTTKRPSDYPAPFFKATEQGFYGILFLQMLAKSQSGRFLLIVKWFREPFPLLSHYRRNN